MKAWLEQSLQHLEKTISPIPHETNELDWKADISDKGDKVARHISAFANTPGGGFLVFGFNNSGEPIVISRDRFEKIISKLGSIAREGVIPSAVISHEIVEYQGENILIVHIQESKQKPTHLRNRGIYDSFLRSGGQTRKMTKDELIDCIKRSRGDSFEEEIVKGKLSAENVLEELDASNYYELLNRQKPSDNNEILRDFENEVLIKKESEVNYGITALGAILFARSIKNFPDISRKAVRVIVYKDKDKTETVREQEAGKGYAVGFVGLINYINSQIPHNEIINDALREDVPLYPKIAIRELVANALIHQDFYQRGSGPMIEIYSDRIEVSNPGNSLIEPLRIIDQTPRSRNEKLAQLMRRMNMCEERGSGIDKVVTATENYGLPAPEFIPNTESFIAKLYTPKDLGEMSVEEQTRACYMHTVLKYVSNEKTTNTTIRKRFNIEKKNYPQASRIIKNTIGARLIKEGNPEIKSNKYKFYVPYWA